MRNFLKNIFLIILAICIAGIIYPQYTMGRTLKFAQLSDLHNSHKKEISGKTIHVTTVARIFSKI